MADHAELVILADPPWFIARWLTDLSISIDGRKGRFPWGLHAFELEPGTHHVEVGIGTSFGRKGVLDVTLVAGEERSLRYRPRFASFLRGRLVDEPLPAARIVRLKR